MKSIHKSIYNIHELCDKQHINSANFAQVGTIVKWAAHAL